MQRAIMMKSWKQHNKTADEWLLTSYLTDHPSKTTKTCWDYKDCLIEKFSEGILHMDVTLLNDKQGFTSGLGSSFKLGCRFEELPGAMNDENSQ